MKIISIVWDEEGGSFSLNHEGCNPYEAIGMLSQALEMASCWEYEESEDDSSSG